MSVLDGALVFVDIETNGLNHLRGRVVEVAAIRMEQGVVTDSFTSLIDPESELPHFITSLTGITTNDLKAAPVFRDIADKLYAMLDGAVFVAHNVRFDYSFLKQEFKRAGKLFSPKQLCTVRLSRALYPEHTSHKLQSLIEQHGINVQARHRAYDDADALRQFIHIIRRSFEPELIEAAIARQIKRPSVPKGINPQILANLPEGPGVYVFEDAVGRPLYIGKSVHIKQRIAAHFSRDHAEVAEFKIAQHIKGITTHQTNGELEALLLESQMIKEMQPLYNKRLRRTSKLLIAWQARDAAGYSTVCLEEVAAIAPSDASHIFAVFTSRSQAKESLQRMVRDYSLCPKLCGLEKARGACFLKQLRRCQGACIGQELPIVYNERLQEAFARRRIDSWPFKGAVLLQEKTGDTVDPVPDAVVRGMVVDQWCIMAHITQEPYSEPDIKHLPRAFDLDTYKILHTFMATKAAKLSIQPLSATQLCQLYGAI